MMGLGLLGHQVENRHPNRNYRLPHSDEHRLSAVVGVYFLLGDSQPRLATPSSFPSGWYV